MIQRKATRSGRGRVCVRFGWVWWVRCWQRAQVLANGPACRATRAVVKAAFDPQSVFNPDRAGPARPDLVGKEFRITRLTQIDKFVRLEPGDYKRNAGHE